MMHKQSMFSNVVGVIERLKFYSIQQLGWVKHFQTAWENIPNFESKIKIHFWQCQMATYGNLYNSNGLQILKEHNLNHIWANLLWILCQFFGLWYPLIKHAIKLFCRNEISTIHWLLEKIEKKPTKEFGTTRFETL